MTVWKKFSSPHKGLMELILRIYFHAAKGNFTIRISYISGVENVVADTLSRFQMDRFRALVPMANLLPELIDSNLTELKRSLHQQHDVQWIDNSISVSTDSCTPTWLQEPEEYTQLELDGSFLFA